MVYLDLEPSMGICGSSLDNKGLIVVEPSGTSNYTWAYASCPLEDECANDHNDCGVHETCEDLVNGFRCLCNDGYARVDR